MEDLCETEVECIKILEFKLDYYTAFHFVEIFLNIGIATEQEAEILCIGDNSLKFLSKTPGIQSKQYQEYDDSHLNLKGRALSTG